MVKKLSPETLKYAKFLHKSRKKNGDKLLPSTIERYVETINPYMDKLVEKSNSQQDLINFINLTTKKSTNAVLYSAMKNYLLFLGYDKYDDEELFNKLKKPQIAANAFSSKRFIQSKVVSRYELRRLFESCEDDKEKLIFSLLYDTACRRNELMKIKFGDIEQKNPTKDSEDIKNGIFADVLLHGKGGKTRTVYLSKLSIDLINKLHQDQDETKYIVRLYKPNGELYASQTQSLYDFIVKKTEHTLNRHIHPHCFRHTKLTHLADEGADILGIQAYAGHEDITTSKIYIQISSFVGRRTFSKYSKPIIDDYEKTLGKEVRAEDNRAPV